MTDNEKLIEELRAVERGSLVGTHAAGSPILRGAELAGRAADALEAAEKAHTPTDDEREALVKSYSGWDADEVARNPRVAADVIERLRSRLLDEFRRTEKPEPSTDHRAIRVCIDIASTVYGDYDDAQGALSDIHMMLAPIAEQSEPQGEPSDAQVEAARVVLRDAWHWTPEVIRAALRAASAA